MEQTIFDMMYPKFKIDKPIKLIEMFGGYGSQFLSLKYINANVEHHKLIEWAVKSIQAYNDIHIQDYTDYSKDLTDDEVLNKLFSLGVSLNYNEPATREQLKRQNYRKIYNNIIATNNLVNIQQVKGRDLEITDKDKYIYVCSYSFPCQDLSNAGKKAGFNDTSTRSGMLWEVERILDECNKLGQLPQVLLMENVIQIHSPGDNVKNFFKWQSKLESLGYKNYMQDLIATDYGIPQTRNRTFMVSILGDYSYTFPKPIPLKLKLKDMLEDNVDEKYYLSDKMIKYISADNEKWTGNNNEALINKTYASTLNTNEGSRRCDASNYISEDVEENYNLKGFHKTLRETLESNNIEEGVNYIDAYNRKIDNSGMAKTISTRIDASNNTYIAIKNATKQGYLEATDGDGIDISSRMEYHRGNVQKEKIQTITTSGGNDRGVVENLRIRKLTPRECGRLMNVKDEDITKILKNQSDSSAYHLFGDSICTNVLMAIFGELLDINWEEKLNELLESKGE